MSWNTHCTLSTPLLLHFPLLRICKHSCFRFSITFGYPFTNFQQLSEFSQNVYPSKTLEQMRAYWESSESCYKAQSQHSQLVFIIACCTVNLYSSFRFEINFFDNKVELSESKLHNFRIFGLQHWVWMPFLLPKFRFHCHGWKQFESGQHLLVSGFWKIILEILRQGESKRKLWGLDRGQEAACALLSY